LDTIGIGIIGSGGIAQGAHMPGYAKLADQGVRIVAVSDVNEATARAAAEKFGVENVYTEYKELLKRDDIHAVSVCTPNFLHKQPTVDALEAGKHVLVEKPIAVNAQEGQEMVDAARRTGRKLQVGLNHRFSPGAQALKKMIEAGDLGEIYFARATAMRRRGIPGWGVFTQKDKQGGGPLIDIGVHILDLTLFLMGHPEPTLCSGQTYAKFGHRDDVVGLMGQWDPRTFTVEDFAVGLVRFTNGSTVYLQSAFVANQEQREAFNSEVFGTEGGASLHPLKIFTEKNRVLLDITPVFLPDVNTHSAEIASFVQSVREDKPVAVPGEEGLKVTKILDAIYKSSEEGREVPV
jgi:predicted dehydrogenase